jgi:hypothetical protein
MGRNTRYGLAILAGFAIICLYPVALALAAALPGLASLLRWMKLHDLPSQIVFPYLMVFGVMTLVAFIFGLIVFQIRENHLVLFACAVTPFIAIFSGINLNLFWSNAPAHPGLLDLDTWIALATVPLGLALAMLVCREPHGV